MNKDDQKKCREEELEAYLEFMEDGEQPIDPHDVELFLEDYGDFLEEEQRTEIIRKYGKS